MIVAAVLGCAAAAAYHVFSTRMQLWLALRAGYRLPLLSVASMFLRLSAVGLFALAVRLWTPLDVVVTSVAFVTLFTVLGGVSLYRFAMGRGPLGTSTLQR